MSTWENEPIANSNLSLVERQAANASDAQPATGAENATAIFLSHKETDHAVALAIKQLITSRFRVSVFLSSDTTSIRVGDDWQKTIEDSLRNSTHLILLYGNPRDKWDWCNYEGGYFLACHSEPNKLAVLHPANVYPPAPFRKWQSVPAKLGKIESWLKEMLKDAETIDPMRPVERSEWAAMSEEIASRVQGLSSQFFEARNIVELEIPAPAPAADNNNLHQATVIFRKGAGPLFNHADYIENEHEKRYAWREVEPSFSSNMFDISGLGDIVRSVRQKNFISEAALRLFLAPADKRGYRPILTRAELQTGDRLRLSFTLVPIPPNFKTDSAQVFDILCHLFQLAVRFRTQVVEANGAAIENASDDTKPMIIKNVLRGIESVIADSHNRRLDEVTDVQAAFTPGQFKLVTKIMEVWKTSFAAVKQCEHTNDFASFQQSMIRLRQVNYMILKLTHFRIGQIIRRFDTPGKADGLDPTLVPLLPKPRKPR